MGIAFAGTGKADMSEAIQAEFTGFETGVLTREDERRFKTTGCSAIGQPDPF